MKRLLCFIGFHKYKSYTLNGKYQGMMCIECCKIIDYQGSEYKNKYDVRKLS